jgi:hypothetical protein
VKDILVELKALAGGDKSAMAKITADLNVVKAAALKAKTDCTAN